MFYINHASALHTSKNIMKVLMNNEFKAQTSTRNPTGNSCCHVLVSSALNMSCSFGQSVCSLESRCLVMIMYEILSGILKYFVSSMKISPNRYYQNQLWKAISNFVFNSIQFKNVYCPTNTMALVKTHTGTCAYIYIYIHTNKYIHKYTHLPIHSRLQQWNG